MQLRFFLDATNLTNTHEWCPSFVKIRVIRGKQLVVLES